MISAVLFDLDGTLVTLGVDIDAARAAIARACGWREPLRPMLEQIDRLSGGVAPLRARAREVLDRYECAAPVAPRPGAVEVLDFLRRKQVPTGLVTNNGRACVVPALRSAGLPAGAFSVIVSRDDVALPKPDPAGLVRAATRLGEQRGGVWWVGDSERDRGAGEAARDLLAPRELRLFGPDLSRLLTSLRDSLGR